MYLDQFQNKIHSFKPMERVKSFDLFSWDLNLQVTGYEICFSNHKFQFDPSWAKLLPYKLSPILFLCEFMFRLFLSNLK